MFCFVKNSNHEAHRRTDGTGGPFLARIRTQQEGILPAREHCLCNVPLLVQAVERVGTVRFQRYLAGFFEQVKSRDFLTLTIQNSHEEDQIHRSPDHWDLERTGIRPESV